LSRGVLRWLAIALAVVLALVAGIALGIAEPWADDDGGAEPRASTDSRGALGSATIAAGGVEIRGVVVLDGAVNGCGGEEILVQVRDATGVVGREVVPSDLEGFDCLYRFAVASPKMDCYYLHVDGNPVGSYRHDTLAPDFIVGYIGPESVWGDPESGEGASPYQDFSGC
jgi:hypothetical protein